VGLLTADIVRACFRNEGGSQRSCLEMAFLMPLGFISNCVSYIFPVLLTFDRYTEFMRKKMISVRLSDERLMQLDEACRELGMNRSEAIDAALRILPEIISGESELRYDLSKIREVASGGGSGDVE